MKARELIPVFEKITQQIPCFTFHKRMLLIKPMGQLLRGVHLDPSAFSREPFDVCAFMMPLRELTDHLHLTFALTIFTDGEDWSMTRPAPGQQREINRFFREDGCHTCGTKDPGTATDNAIADHQPASALVPSGTPQRYFPQCLRCSRIQGGRVKAFKEYREKSGQ